jgi:hypothetical protein
LSAFYSEKLDNFLEKCLFCAVWIEKLRCFSELGLIFVYYCNFLTFNCYQYICLFAIEQFMKRMVLDLVLAGVQCDAEGSVYRLHLGGSECAASQVKFLVQKHILRLGVEPLGITIDKLNVLRLSRFAFDILGITVGRSGGYGSSRENRVSRGNMEQVKPFHVPQERKNALVLDINGKGHIHKYNS